MSFLAIDPSSSFPSESWEVAKPSKTLQAKITAPQRPSQAPVTSNHGLAGRYWPRLRFTMDFASPKHIAFSAPGLAPVIRVIVVASPDRFHLPPARDSSGAGPITTAHSEHKWTLPHMSTALLIYISL